MQQGLKVRYKALKGLKVLRVLKVQQGLKVRYKVLKGRKVT